MSGFVKLDCSILKSSIMLEDSDTFKAWIIFLASCNSEGIAEVPLSDLMMRCRITAEKAKEIVDKLSAPDPVSKSKEKEGRRIVPHGESGFHYLVVNYKKYRDFTYSSNPEAIKKRRQRGHGEYTIVSQSGLETVEVPFLKGDIPGPVPTPLSSVPLSSNSSSELDIPKKPIKKKKEKKKTFGSIHYQLAEMLRDKIKSLGTSMIMTDGQLESWANTFRLMMEQDERTVEQIRKIINEIFSGTFWQGVIRSADTLRLRWNEGKLDNLKPQSYKKQDEEDTYKDPPKVEMPPDENKAISLVLRVINELKGVEITKYIAYARSSDIGLLRQAYYLAKDGKKQECCDFMMKHLTLSFEDYKIEWDKRISGGW